MAICQKLALSAIKARKIKFIYNKNHTTCLIRFHIVVYNYEIHIYK